MLHERWTKIVEERRDQVALISVSGDEVWAFGDLDEIAAEIDGRKLVVAPFDNRPEIFFARIIAAWRDGGWVLPLEPGFDLERLRPPETGLPEGLGVIKHTAIGDGTEAMVALDAASQMAEADALMAATGIGPDYVGIAAVSPSHSYGFGVLALPMLLGGMPVVVPESPLQPCVSEAVRRASKLVKATGRDGCFLPGVPATWRAWAASGILAPEVGGSKVLGISAGSPLTLELADRVFSQTGIRIGNLYGTSETGAISWDSDPLANLVGQPGGVGKLLPSVSADVEAGRLNVRSSSWAGLGYIRPGSVGIDDFGGSGFSTYDQAERCSDGTIVLGEFVGDTINVAGRKLSPRRIEKAVQQANPEISRAKVVGIPSRDRERNSEVGLAVSFRAGDPVATAREIRSRVGAVLDSWEVPRKVWTLEPEDELWDAQLAPFAWRQTLLDKVLPAPIRK